MTAETKGDPGMKRRGFFAKLAGLVLAPFVAKEIVSEDTAETTAALVFKAWKCGSQMEYRPGSPCRTTDIHIGAIDKESFIKEWEAAIRRFDWTKVDIRRDLT